MITLGSIISGMQHVGCSPFFFTSAIQSSIFGNIARDNQEELLDANLEFREKMQGLRNEYNKEHIDAQKLFKRENYELGRQYLIQQTLAQNISRRKQIEFQDFLNHNPKYWPLEVDVYTMLDAQQDMLEHQAEMPLNILIAKTEVTSDSRNTHKYRHFCEFIIDGLRQLPTVTIEVCPWKNVSQSRIGDAMNINYIMSGIPTMAIFPYQMGDSLMIETASWSFGRGLQSMSQQKSLKINDIAPKLFEDTAIAAVEATIGMARDAYAIAEYHKPAAYLSMLSDDMLQISPIKVAIHNHYSQMNQLIESSEFRQLCLHEEIKDIEDSLRSNRLLTA